MCHRIFEMTKHDKQHFCFVLRDGACRNLVNSGAGAICCQGAIFAGAGACFNTLFEPAPPGGQCERDMCCSGPSSCQLIELLGSLRSVSCDGPNSCRSLNNAASDGLLGDLRCNGLGACIFPDVKFRGEEHAVSCSGPFSCSDGNMDIGPLEPRKHI